MIGYPPTQELYLGCDCMDLDHVALFIHFPPKRDNDGKVIIEEDDPPCIYCNVTTNNYFRAFLPSIRYIFDKMTWQSFAHYNWYRRLWVAGRYIFTPAYHIKHGILDCFDFRIKDYEKLDAFISLISSDIDANIDEQSEVWLEDDRWCIKIKATRWVSKEHDIIEPWKVGWETHFKPRGFFGRVRWAFKYIFGRHCPEKSFEIYEKEASQIRGMIKWVQKENEKGEANVE
jgi:hypothetical protein